MLGRVRALFILFFTLLLPGCTATRPAGAPGEEAMSLEGALGNRFVPAGSESAVVAGSFSQGKGGSGRRS